MDLWKAGDGLSPIACQFWHKWWVLSQGKGRLHNGGYSARVVSSVLISGVHIFCPYLRCPQRGDIEGQRALEDDEARPNSEYAGVEAHLKVKCRNMVVVMREWKCILRCKRLHQQ